MQQADAESIADIETFAQVPFGIKPEAPIGEHTTYWGHVGMYGFRGDVLAGWDQLPASPLEDLERLEQLRLIEAGLTIATFRVEGTSLSVDTAEQLEQARAMV